MYEDGYLLWEVYYNNNEEKDKIFTSDELFSITEGLPSFEFVMINNDHKEHFHVMFDCERFDQIIEGYPKLPLLHS